MNKLLFTLVGSVILATDVVANPVELVKADFNWGGGLYASVNGSAMIGSPGSGGNPGSYWQTSVTAESQVNGLSGWVVVYSTDSALTFDPSAHGKQLRIDYYEDSRMFSGDARGMLSGLVILQGLGRYFLKSPLLVDQAAWTTQSRLGLEASDFEHFTGLGFQPNVQPDFSGNGEPMRFGVYRRLDRFDGAGRTVHAGLDNLRIVIHLVPEPTGFLGLALGGGLLVGSRSMNPRKCFVRYA